MNFILGALLLVSITVAVVLDHKLRKQLSENRTLKDFADAAAVTIGDLAHHLVDTTVDLRQANEANEILTDRLTTYEGYNTRLSQAYGKLGAEMFEKMDTITNLSNSIEILNDELSQKELELALFHLNSGGVAPRPKQLRPV